MPSVPARPSTPYPGQTRGRKDDNNSTTPTTTYSSCSTTAPATTTKPASDPMSPSRWDIRSTSPWSPSSTPPPDTNTNPLLTELNARLARLLAARGPVRQAARLVARKAHSDQHDTTKSKTQVNTRRRMEMLWPQDPLWGRESDDKALIGPRQRPRGFGSEEEGLEQEEKEEDDTKEKKVSFSTQNLLDNWQELRKMERGKSLDYVTVGKARQGQVRKDLLRKAFGRFEASLGTSSPSQATRRGSRRESSPGVVESMCLKDLRSKWRELRQQEVEENRGYQSSSSDEDYAEDGGDDERR